MALAPELLPPVLLVADSSATLGRPLAQVLRESIEAGIRGVWLREKHANPADRRRLAEELAGLAHASGGVLVASPGPGSELADGLHFGASDERLPGTEAKGPGGVGDSMGTGLFPAQRRVLAGSGRPVGRSCHSRHELGRAAAEGCLWATLSPIFASSSKPGYGPVLGVAALSGLPLPTWALGGVDARNAALCLESGATGVVVMSAILGAAHPGRAAQELVRTVERTLS